MPVPIGEISFNYRIIMRQGDGKLLQIKSNLIDENRKEREDLELWIKTNPEILGKDILLIGEQVHSKSGYIDFLGIDNNGKIILRLTDSVHACPLYGQDAA